MVVLVAGIIWLLASLPLALLVGRVLAGRAGEVEIDLRLPVFGAESISPRGSAA
jgi:hypothetical protein